MSLALALFSLPFLPLAHGNEAILRKGTVLTAALDGDVILDRGSVFARQPTPLPKKGGPASINFYWPNDGSRGVDRITCGKVNLGKLSAGRNFTTHLPAANYWFSMSDKKRAVSLAVESGGEYFVRVPFVPGSRGGNGLAPIEHDIGEAEASETRPLEPRKILDMTTASLNDLQADPRRKKVMGGP